MVSQTDWDRTYTQNETPSKVIAFITFITPKMPYDFLFYLRSAFAGKAVIEYSASPYQLLRLCKQAQILVEALKPQLYSFRDYDTSQIKVLEIPEELSEPTQLVPTRFKRELLAMKTPSAPPVKLPSGWFLPFPTKINSKASIKELKLYFDNLPRTKEYQPIILNKEWPAYAFDFHRVSIPLLQELGIKDPSRDEQYGVRLALQTLDCCDTSWVVSSAVYNRSKRFQFKELPYEEGWKVVECLLKLQWGVMNVHFCSIRMLPEWNYQFNFNKCPTSETEDIKQPRQVKKQMRYYINRLRQEEYSFIWEYDDVGWILKNLSAQNDIYMKMDDVLTKTGSFVYDAEVKQYNLFMPSWLCQYHGDRARSRLQADRTNCLRDAVEEDLSRIRYNSDSKQDEK